MRCARRKCRSPYWDKAKVVEAKSEPAPVAERKYGGKGHTY